MDLRSDLGLNDANHCQQNNSDYFQNHKNYRKRKIEGAEKNAQSKKILDQFRFYLCTLKMSANFSLYRALPCKEKKFFNVKKFPYFQPS